MSKDITPQNVFNFFEGNLTKLMSGLGLSTKCIEEQVQYRLTVCKDDCVKIGSCKKCGCSLPGRAYTSQTCNADRFPDFMNNDEWTNFKISNNLNNTYTATHTKLDTLLKELKEFINMMTKFAETSSKEYKYDIVIEPKDNGWQCTTTITNEHNSIK
jgi:hypothetical protein